MRKVLRWAVVLFVGADLLVAGLWVAVAHYPALPVYWTGVSEIAPFCSRWQAVVDSGELKRIHEMQSEIAGASRSVQVDGRWQLIKTPLGNWWITLGPDRTLSVLLVQHETNYYGDSTTGVHRGDIVIDCGSHIGTFTRHALKRGARKIIAVDPAPDAAECFRRNFVSEISSGKVVLIEKGVWDSEGSLAFNLNGNSDAADSFVVSYDQTKQIVVPVTTIDTIVGSLKLERVDFIKADVKGATVRMLNGSSDTLKRFRPRMALATEEPPEDPAAIVAAARRTVSSYVVDCGYCFVAEHHIRLSAVFLH